MRACRARASGGSESAGNAYSFGWEATVGLREDELSARLEDAVDLTKDLERTDEIIDRYDACHHIKGGVVERYRRVDIQILWHIIGCKGAFPQRGVHSRAVPRGVLCSSGRMIGEVAAASRLEHRTRSSRVEVRELHVGF